MSPFYAPRSIRSLPPTTVANIITIAKAGIIGLTVALGVNFFSQITPSRTVVANRLLAIEHATGSFQDVAGVMQSSHIYSKSGGLIAGPLENPFFEFSATGSLGTMNRVRYTWPSADGSANQRLTTDGSAGLSWATVSGGGGGGGTLTGSGNVDTFAYYTAAQTLSGTHITRVNDQTLSGGYLHADTKLSSSGELVVVGQANFFDEIEQTFLAVKNLAHATDLDVDAAGFGGVVGLRIDYDSGTQATSELNALLDLSLNRFDTTGGDTSLINCSATEGSADAHCMVVNSEIEVILQHVGAFGDMDTATATGTTNMLAAFISTTTDRAIFPNDNDTIEIADAAQFDQIQFALDTEASNPGIKPTFEYSTGVATWETFAPIDGTEGMRASGLISFEADTLSPAWTTGTGSEFYIRIARTQNNLNTTPIENLVQIVTGHVDFTWDQTGNVYVNEFSGSKLNISGAMSGFNIHAQDSLTSSGTLSVEGTTRFQSATDATDFFQINDTDGGTTIFNVDTTNERVGIGTASPDASLEIALDANTPPTIDADTAAIFTQASVTGDNVNISLVAGATGNARLQFGDTADENAGIIDYDHNSNSMAFTTNASEVVRIDSSGDVGIGSIAPAAHLHIAKTGVPTIRLSDTGAGTDQAVATLMEFYRGETTNRVGFLGMGSASNDVLIIGTDYSAGEIRFSTSSNSVAVTIDSSQNVGIGTTSPISELEVIGSISGAKLFISTSFSGAGLTSCSAAGDTLNWNSTTELFECGTDADSGGGGDFGTGNTITIGDSRYVNLSGDTMTGNLVLQSSTLTATGGVFTGTLSASGAVFFEDTLDVGGTAALQGVTVALTLAVTGRATFDDDVDVQGALSGWHLFSGTQSGSGLTDCNGANVNRQQWDSTTEKWSCDTDAISLTADVTGTLPIANGGTNQTSAAVAGAVVYSTSSAMAFTSAGNSGQVLISQGTSAPIFSSGALRTGFGWFSIGLTDAGVVTGSGSTSPVPLPFRFHVEDILLDINNAPGGQSLIVDILEDGTSITSTNAEIDALGNQDDNNHVISDRSLAVGARMTIDITQVGTDAAGHGTGLTVLLRGWKYP